MNTSNNNNLDQNLRDELSKCTRCNLCIYVCPPYNKIKEAQLSPRGIIEIIKSDFDLSKADNITKACRTSCSKEALCAKECPTGVDFMALINYFDYEG